MIWLNGWCEKYWVLKLLLDAVVELKVRLIFNEKWFNKLVTQGQNLQGFYRRPLLPQGSSTRYCSLTIQLLTLGIPVSQGISILTQAGTLVKVPLFGPLCKAGTMMVIQLNTLKIKAWKHLRRQSWYITCLISLMVISFML